jgi:hypothetical protein
MKLKLIYPDSTIVEAKDRPSNFTGTVEYEEGKNFYLNGMLHRDGGLPAVDYTVYMSYWVNGNITGRFYPSDVDDNPEMP